MVFRPLLALLLALTTLSTPALAQWQYIGTPVSATVQDQRVITVCPDGAGGAILTWEDYRVDGSSADVYAQRMSASGVPQWTANGVAICTAASYQYQPRIVSDGAGGAIITWMDFRSGNYEVYAQRINGSGTPLWTANGVQLTAVTGDQVWPVIAADGSGGALISWYDNRNGATGQDIYVQRINSAGTALWTANGVALCTISGDQTQQQVATDGSGGAVVVWKDARAAPTITEIFGQRVNSAGVVQWASQGLVVCNAANNQYDPMIIPDGAGGTITTWSDDRNNLGVPDIYAQRLNSSGTALWTANGQAICTATNVQNQPLLVSDGSQGAIIVWQDSRGAATDLYAQHIAGAGNVLWGGNGIPVSAATNNQVAHQVVSDGAGGAIVTWADIRSGTGYQLYAQRMDASGVARWTTDGVQVCGTTLSVTQPRATDDGAGNAIVAWYANPAGEANVYAQRIDGQYGYWGKPDPTLYAAKDVPNDQGGRVRLEWYASGRDVSNQQVITHYTIWRAIDQAAFATASAAGVPVVSLSDKLSGRAVRHDKAQAVDYFWELIGTQDATYRYAYAFTAATSFDSTASNAATHRFQVAAHANQFVSWTSNVLSGRSVDNLAPPAPLYLTAQRIGNYVYLKWNGVHVPDLDKYTVYRATSTGVTPIAPNFLADDTDTLLTDATAPASALYYIVTATDIHQNQGLKSNEASVAATTGAGGVPPLTALTVRQNYPNPFTGETTLDVGLPARSDVRVEIYDVAGRRVREMVVPQQGKGWNVLRLDARDDRGRMIPSGVYFYRVHAGGEVVTRRMVITR